MQANKQETSTQTNAYAATKSDCSDHTVLPATIVATALPCNFQLLNGLLRDLLADSATRNIHSVFKSNTVTSASAPTLKVPFFRFNNRDGLTVNFAIISDSESFFV